MHVTPVAPVPLNVTLSVEKVADIELGTRQVCAVGIQTGIAIDFAGP